MRNPLSFPFNFPSRVPCHNNEDRYVANQHREEICPQRKIIPREESNEARIRSQRQFNLIQPKTELSPLSALALPPAVLRPSGNCSNTCRQILAWPSFSCSTSTLSAKASSPNCCPKPLKCRSERSKMACASKLT